MKKIFALMAVLVLLSGCSAINGNRDSDKTKIDNYKAFMAEIPDHEFERFDYHRNGYVSTSNITATGAKKENGKLVVESIVFSAKYGGESISITLEGYGREFAEQPGQNDE